jgi:transposase InsO family protein
MIYAYIDEQRVNVSVVRLCHALGVSTSGYYAGRRREPSQRARANEALLVQLRAIRVETHETYGSPRMHAELVARGQPCSVNRVARLMRLNHLAARHKRPYRPKTTCPDATRAVVPNRLAQDFTADAPNTKWVGDITYIPTSQGWLYLAAVLDLYSRRIVGWALDQTMTTDLVRAALEMALGRRQPAAGLLHHTDRGSQYTSTAYQDLLTAHGLVASLSGTGYCYDNAPMESFFATLKTELIYHRHYATRLEAKTDIFEYIEVFYNRLRRHSALGYRNPVAFEKLALAA